MERRAEDTEGEIEVLKDEVKGKAQFILSYLCPPHQVPLPDQASQFIEVCHFAIIYHHGKILWILIFSVFFRIPIDCLLAFDPA
jgi:hypothetical protein